FLRPAPIGLLVAAARAHPAFVTAGVFPQAALVVIAVSLHAIVLAALHPVLISVSIAVLASLVVAVVIPPVVVVIVICPRYAAECQPDRHSQGCQPHTVQ